MHIETDPVNPRIPADRRKTKPKNRHILPIAVIAILCSIIACATIAFLHTDTNPAENIFTDAYVACEISETFDGTTKSNVTVKNTGEVQSYIRAKVVVTWMSADQTKVTALKPIEGADYVITYANETDPDAHWKKGSDGYWYYKLPVDVEEETETLIETCSPKEGATAPFGYWLSVEIVASSIQSTPTRVVTEQWSSGVRGVNGSELIIR